MRLSICIWFSFIFLSSQSQDDVWLSVNNGLGNPTEFKVEWMGYVNGKILAACEFSDERNGLYQFGTESETWAKIGEKPIKYGFGLMINTSTNLYSSHGTTCWSFNFESGGWERLKDANGQDLEMRIQAASGNKVYSYLGSEKEGFAVLEWDVKTKISKNLGWQGGSYPLPAENLNKMRKMVALPNSRVYVSYAWMYTATDGRKGAVYEYYPEDNKWVDISGGLNLINTVASNWGPFEGIIANEEGTSVFAVTERAYYMRPANVEVHEGWYQMGSRAYADAGVDYAIGDKLFGYSRGGYVRRIDKNIQMNLGIPPTIDACDKSRSAKHIASPDGGQTIFTSYSANPSSDCEGNESVHYGIYKLTVDEEKPSTVTNLHVSYASYLGDEGISESLMNSTSGVLMVNDQILVAGTFVDGHVPSKKFPFVRSTDQHAGFLVYDSTGKQLKEKWCLGSNIYDVDYQLVDGNHRIVAIGSFGIVVLDEKGQLIWNDTIATALNSKVSMAENGYVAAVVKGKEAGNVVLFDKMGKLKGTNTGLDVNGRHINDIEINASEAHQKIYVGGFVQASGNLQVAYIFAYDIDDVNAFKYKVWGFNAEEAFAANNGADTRVYHLESNDNNLYASGESAGGGPGGFSIFAYNGKNQTDKVADKGNDIYSDGTNSCGACHISFFAKIDPGTGTVLKGKFIHGRLPNGKTNTHRVRSCAIKVDDKGNVYAGAVAAYQIQNREIFNINGKLTGEYAGNDFVLLVLSPTLQTRVLWASFCSNRGGGNLNGIAIGDNKVAICGTTDRGVLFTTPDANRTISINKAETDDEKAITDAYLAIWPKKIWETANLNEPTYPLIPVDECFKTFGDEKCNHFIEQDPTFDDGFLIYPNPVNQSFFTLKGILDRSFAFKDFSISIFNNAGMLVWQESYSGNEYPRLSLSLDATAFYSGIYYLVLTQGGKQVSKKFIVDRSRF